MKITGTKICRAALILLWTALHATVYAQNKPTAGPAQSSPQQPGIIEFWKDAALTVQVYGGLNYSTKSTYASAVDSAFGTAATYLSPAFGATVWFGNNVSQIGVSGGYQVPYSNTLTVSSTTYTQKVTQIPIVGYARYFVIPNLYVGLGGGVAVNMLKIDSGTATTYTATVPVLGLRAGYDYEISKNIFVGGALDVSYYFWTVNQKATTSGTASDYSANALNLTPMITVGMKF